MHYNHTDSHKLRDKLTQTNHANYNSILIASSHLWQPTWIPPSWMHLWTYLSHTGSHKLWNSNCNVTQSYLPHCKNISRYVSQQDQMLNPLSSKRKVVKYLLDPGFWIAILTWPSFSANEIGVLPGFVSQQKLVGCFPPQQKLKGCFPLQQSWSYDRIASKQCLL